MKNDISNRDDIRKLVFAFHKALLKDNDMAQIFEQASDKDTLEHLEAMTDFWESALFQAGIYKENTLDLHLAVHSKYRLQAKHFNHWLNVFRTITRELYEGPVAELAITKAITMASVIKMKIDHLEELRKAINN